MTTENVPEPVPPTSTTVPEGSSTTVPDETTTTGSRRGRHPRVRRAGFDVGVPPGWEVRIRERRDLPPGSVGKPVVHCATVALHQDDADFGGGVVETLGPEDVFLSMVEFGEEAIDSALFPPIEEFPFEIEADKFHPMQLQRLISGQAGQQVFFSHQGRAFCLYVVIGSAALTRDLAVKASEVLKTMDLEPNETP